jgi:hypothetical protein
MNLTLKLRVKDIFYLKGGRTVLVGPVEGEAKYIRAGDYELWVNDRQQGRIHLEGEMISNPAGQTRGDMRCVSTCENTGLTRELVADGSCVLCSVD